MASSTSRGRPGHEKAKHLPKVGTPAEMEWARETRMREVFGPARWRRIAMLLVAAAIIGLVLLYAL